MTAPQDDEPRTDPALLEDWAPPEPAGDFVDRVMTRVSGAEARDEEKLSRRPPWVHSGLGFVAGIAAAAAAFFFIAQTTEPTAPKPEPMAIEAPAAGELTAVRRTTTSIGSRGTVVAEPGAHLSWRTQNEVASIEQDSGSVFYRVDPGLGELHVQTPRGKVRVTGTCFTLDVSEARTDVDVHEGSVELHHGDTVVEVHAGERVRLNRSGISRAPSSPSSPAATVSPVPTPAEACDCVEDVSRIDPGDEALARWAKECRVNTDTPPLGITDQQLAEWVAKLEVDADEAAVITETLRAVEKRADHKLERIYVDATGDEDGVGKVDILLMYDEVMRSAAIGEQARVRQKLARERAGLDNPPTDMKTVTPYEEQMRVLAGLGDELEAELGKRLAPTRVRSLRAIHGGWPGRGFHAVGCP
jgi:hypothetical protein